MIETKMNNKVINPFPVTGTPESVLGWVDLAVVGVAEGDFVGVDEGVVEGNVEGVVIAVGMIVGVAEPDASKDN